MTLTRVSPLSRPRIEVRKETVVHARAGLARGGDPEARPSPAAPGSAEQHVGRRQRLGAWSAARKTRRGRMGDLITPDELVPKHTSSSSGTGRRTRSQGGRRSPRVS
jgi:hypothetical protein